MQALSIVSERASERKLYVYFGCVDKMFYEHGEQKERKLQRVITQILLTLCIRNVFFFAITVQCMDMPVYMDLCMYLIFIAFNINGIYYIYISLERRAI